MENIYIIMQVSISIHAVISLLSTASWAASPKYFFSDYFAIPKFCYTFVAVNELATTYQSNDRMQGILKFFASFCADYLVNPNNLLTHTHTHTHRRT